MYFLKGEIREYILIFPIDKLTYSGPHFISIRVGFEPKVPNFKLLLTSLLGKREAEFVVWF